MLGRPRVLPQHHHDRKTSKLLGERTRRRRQRLQPCVHTHLQLCGRRNSVLSCGQWRLPQTSKKEANSPLQQGDRRPPRMNPQLLASAPGLVWGVGRRRRRTLSLMSCFLPRCPAGVCECQVPELRSWVARISPWSAAGAHRTVSSRNPSCYCWGNSWGIAWCSESGGPHESMCCLRASPGPWGRLAIFSPNTFLSWHSVRTRSVL